MTEDYYALLGVDQAASEEAILQAYREKAAEHHPDVSNADDAESTFQRLHEAKDVLTDEERRREYDRIGHEQYVADSQRDRCAGRSTARPRARAGGSGVGYAPPTGLHGFLREFLEGSSAWMPPSDGRPQGSRTGGSWDPFVIDLEAHLDQHQRPGRSRGAGETSGRTDRKDPRQTECPRCRGRGRFVHEIDTARGSTRRVEPCERCGGNGAIRGSE